MARLVSFPANRNGYIKQSNISIPNKIRILLKFKTKESDGLIFYVTDREQTSGISLSLVKGCLKLVSQKVELISNDCYFNDSEWHVINVIQNSEKMILSYDDYATLT